MPVVGPNINASFLPRIKAMLVGRYGLDPTASAAQVSTALSNRWRDWLRAEVIDWESNAAATAARVSTQAAASTELGDLA